MFSKVIVSHRGELTEDMRATGDTIRYRIYFKNTAQLAADIVITDPLDRGLTQITPFNHGQYDPQTHTITWAAKGVRPGRQTVVEFEAVVGQEPGRIVNQAILEGFGRRRVRSNTVETTVVASPRLGWIPLEVDAQPGAPMRIAMKDETTSGATIRFDIPGVYVYEERVDGVAYQRLALPGRAALTDVGKPELPVTGELLEVPFGVSFTPEVIETKTVVLEGFNVYPTQPPLLDGGGVATPPRPRPTAARKRTSAVFHLDKATYGMRGDYPQTVAVAAPGDIGVIRGHRVLFLKVNPIRYNPVTGTLTISPMIEVRVNYNHPAQLKAVNRRIASPAFEEMLQAAVLNYKEPQRFYQPALSEAATAEVTGCDYLIITHDAFYNDKDPNNPIVRLRNWKQRKGYRTRVVKVGSIAGGNTASAIQTYIQDAYNRWNPAPTYVLLVGDADLVRTFPGSTSAMPPIETDLYYATVDQGDYYPDIYVGRLVADTLQQVTNEVDKILAYEQHPPATPAHADFYSNASLVANFTDQAAADGREDRPWIANVETIRQYLLSRNYAVERIYATDSGYPTNLSAPAPRRYHDGSYLPADLVPPNYAWRGGRQDIANALNNGRFLVAYRGHGNRDGWDFPPFANGDVGGLNQNNLTPIVFSITCQTGWFDNETDDDSKGGAPTSAESFAETLLRRPSAGAAAVLGMTRNSYSGWNDFLVYGLFKALWPDFIPDPPWANHPPVPPFSAPRLFRMGQMLTFSKVFMAKAYPADATRKVEFELEHLFGDPEMPMWTQAPGDLQVVHPDGIGSIGLQEFVVTVMDAATEQPVHNATVVLTRDNAIVAMQQTDSYGLAHFSLDAVGLGDLDITVTALVFRPYMGVIRVSRTGATLNRIDPANGPTNQTIHVGGQGFVSGETIELAFGRLAPILTVADDTGGFGQGVPTVDMLVPADYPHGLVNILAHGRTSGRYAVRIFHVRAKNPVDLWSYDQWDSSTWVLHPGDNPTWDSPDIQLYQGGTPVGSDNLIVGDTYTVATTVRNRSAFSALQARVVFHWRDCGAGGPWDQFATDTVDVPPSGTASAQATFQPPTTGHLCILTQIEHLEDISLNDNQGQENLHVGISQSPTEVPFLVWNPTDRAAPIHLEVRQLIPPGKERKERLWAAWVRHPDPQILQPGQRARASVVVDPAQADIAVGTQAEFAVTAFIGSTMIGGVNLKMTRQ